MKRILSAVLPSAAVLLMSQMAAAQGAPPPPPPPEEVNILVLMDVSGSMIEVMPNGQTKMEIALERARNYVNAHRNDTGVEFALWAFDSSYPGPDHYKVLRDFPATADQVLNDLGADGTVHADLTPQNLTPLAGAACAAVGRVAAKLDENGNLIEGGYEWGKLKPGTNTKVRIQRRIFIGTDGLENDTPSGHPCGGTTSSATFETYEPGSWQAKVRNMLLSGNPNRTIVADNGLVMDVQLIFRNFVSGLSYGAESGYSSSTSYSTEPSLYQALEFYSGAANATGGSFQAVTFRANGQLDARYPGDVDYSGCVSEADYFELLQWYGQPVNPNHPHSYWADVTGDGVVDEADYLLIVEHWGEGPTC